MSLPPLRGGRGGSPLPHRRARPGPRRAAAAATPQPFPVALLHGVDPRAAAADDWAMADALRLTAAEFDALLERTGRLSLDSLRIARAVVVDGQRPGDVARATGRTTQRVYAILKRFEAAYREVPPHWRRVEVWLPPELADEVEAMAERARRGQAADAAGKPAGPGAASP